MLFSFLHHAVDVFLWKSGATGDGDGLFLAGATVLRGNVDDTVGVDVEGDLNLRNTTWSRSNTGQLEGAEQLVVTGELTLTLVDLNEHGRLTVFGGREDLGRLGRDRGVAIDQLGHNATLGLDAEAQRGHVDQQDVLAVALDDAGLEGRTNGDDLIGVHALVRFTATGQLLDHVGNGRHTGGATDQNHVVNVVDRDSSFGNDVVERLLRTVEQVRGHFLELCAGQGLVQVDRAVCGHRQVLQGDVSRGCAGEFLLGLLSGFLQALQSDGVLGQVRASLRLDLINQPVDDALIPVVATEAVVAGGCANLNGRETVVILADFEQGDVKGSTTEVENQDEFIFLALFEAVCKCCCGGLVNDALDVEACDLARVLRCLTLSIVEVGGDSDDGIGDGLAEECFCVSLQLGEDARGDFLSGVLLIVNFDAPVGAHVTLDRGDCTVNVGHSLTLCDFADEDLARLGECDDGRRGAHAFCVRDDCGFTAFEDSDCGVGGTEVNTYCTCHVCVPFVQPPSFAGDCM